MAERHKPSVAEALTIIRDSVPVLPTARLASSRAFGCVLAEDAFARLNVPSFRASAMDGYACRAGDLPSSTRHLIVAGDGAAGTWPAPLPRDRVAPISTGAPVPEGADCVVPRERAKLSGGTFSSDHPWPTGSNVREIGEDFAAGMLVGRAGTWIGPDLVGGLVASGCVEVAVRRPPGVAILSTGSELGRDRGPAGIPDANGPMLASHVAALGLPESARGAAADDPVALLNAIDRLEGQDLLLSTGGVSAGNRDLVREALERRGDRILFHGVAMRPGKPILFAILRSGRPFLGLPGNPAAALVGFRFFAIAALRAMLGLKPEVGEPASTVAPGRSGTTLFLRGRRGTFSNDGWLVDVGIDQRSHILSSAVAADCWLQISDVGGSFRHQVFEKLPRLGVH